MRGLERYIDAIFKGGEGSVVPPMPQLAEQIIDAQIAASPKEKAKWSTKGILQLRRAPVL
jgi:hypothetical protein